MNILLRVFTVVFLIICVVLTIVILMQEGKQAGLGGTINGIADTYWGRNKGRSVEGKLEKWTKIFVAVFFILAVVLSMNFMGY